MKYDWQRLVTEILDRRVWTQLELAEACQSSQQAVSAWVAGAHVPTQNVRRKLLLIASEVGIDPALWSHPDMRVLREPDPEWSTEKSEKSARAARLDKLFQRLSEAPESVQEAVIEYAEFRLSKM